MEQKTTYTLAEYEHLQHRYDQLLEKLGNAQERIEELEVQNKELEDKLTNASDVLSLIQREAKDAWLKI